MIPIRHFPDLIVRPLFFCSVLFIHIVGSGYDNRVEAGEALKTLPSLEQALAMATRYSSKRDITKSEVIFEVKRNYDLVLARREQLEISREVQEHFKKALTQAEKKFEEGEGEVSLTALTKLELGLAGTLSDISQFKSDIALAQLYLEKYMGVQWAGKVDISGPQFRPAKFPFKTIDEYSNSRKSTELLKKPGGLFEQRKAFIKINQAREKYNQATQSRKMTRALLVTEVANYDFGIGNEADLFEALIIYTRVLIGYYDAVYALNLSVYHFLKIDGVP